MSSIADTIIETRALRRSAGAWRIAAFVAAAIAILALGARLSDGWLGGGAYIARVRVISGQEAQLKAIRDLAKSPASAVLLDLDSPGGTTAGSEELYLALRELAQKKPIAAVVGTMAASGAYIAALGADRIFVRGNSIVGSIGVIVEFPNFSGLLDKVGVQFEEIKSSPLKAAPNGLTPTSPEARQAMADLVADSYAWFKDLVKTRRAMSDDELAKIDDGRVFSGRQGVGLKLADAIGGEAEAIDWLVKEKGVAKDLPVRETQTPGALERFGLGSSLAAGALDALGWRRAAEFVKEAGLDGGETPSGLMSIWRVDAR